jgi:hypothetical protein
MYILNTAIPQYTCVTNPSAKCSKQRLNSAQSATTTIADDEPEVKSAKNLRTRQHIMLFFLLSRVQTMLFCGFRVAVQRWWCSCMQLQRDP